MKRSLTALFVALALLVVGTSAQADTTPPVGDVLWEYNFTPVMPAPPVGGGGAGLYADNAVGSNAGITFTNDSTKTAEGPSKSIVASNLKAFSPSTGKFEFTNGGNWSMSMVLTHSDANGPHSKTLMFGGKFDGDFSWGKSNLTNTMLGFYDANGLLTENESMKVTLGAYDFTVTLIPVIMPGQTSSGIQGAIGAKVDIAATGSGEPAGTPEPSTMLLAGFGMTFLGASAWRKRRARAAA